MLSQEFLVMRISSVRFALFYLKTAAIRLLFAFKISLQVLCVIPAPVMAQVVESPSSGVEEPIDPAVMASDTLDPMTTAEPSEYVKKLMTHPDGSPNDSNPISTTQLATTVAGLFAVIGMIFVAGWLVRRLSGGQVGSANSTIKVIANHPLGTKEKLCLIDVAGQQILVGMTAQSMQTLLVLDEPVDIKPKAWASESVNSVFGAKLQSILKGAPVNEGKQSKVDD